MLLFHWLKRVLTDPPTPAQIRNRSFLVLICLAFAIGYTFKASGLFVAADTSVGPGDLDLSGTWKIKFTDMAEFAQAQLNDSDWCLISVPDSGIVATGATGRDFPSTNCPQTPYPRERMWNATYWYRKSFNLPAGKKWKNPSLFIGSIKQQGWVYWDGLLIGSATYETNPNILLLREDLLLPGSHQLAIKVQSLASSYPGLFHGYPKGVAVTEYSEAVKEVQRSIQLHFEHFFGVTVQIVALLLIFFLLIRGSEGKEEFFWLAIYFGASCIFAASNRIATEWKLVGESTSSIMMSTALSGYGSLLTSRSSRFFVRRTILMTGLLSICVQIGAIYLGQWKFLKSNVLEKVIAIYAVIFVIASLFISHKGSEQRNNEHALSRAEFAIVCCLLMLHGQIVIDRVIMASRSVFFHPAFVTSTLTFAIMMLAVEHHLQQERVLAFFGRFIKPGLRSLLSSNKAKKEHEQEWFRGKRVPIMKVDIVGYSSSTYGFPYGIKRLFSHLWFTHIDSVMESKVFFDKPEGDGSIYCLREGLEGGSCAAALRSAIQVRDRVVEAFDSAFEAEVKLCLSKIPELRAPFEKYTTEYTQRNGAPFWLRRTAVRFALVYGFVDEGLWGLKSQSHYDVQGDLLILSARLEKLANSGEILVSDAFLEKLQTEDPQLASEFEPDWRQADLKGIGSHRFAILRTKKSGNRSAA